MSSQRSFKEIKERLGALAKANKLLHEKAMNNSERSQNDL
jgi:hypothetical protein